MHKFEQLPDEILIKIFYDYSLTAEDLISLSNVCRRFDDVSNYEELWKSKFQRRWCLAWKKAHSGSFISSSSINWRKEVEENLKINTKLEETLRSSSFISYKFQTTPSTIISSVCELFSLSMFGHLVILNELHDIVYNGRKVDLTVKYYARQILYYVNIYVVKEELENFFSFSPEKQSSALERGAFYIAKALQPQEFFDLDYKDISSKLDSLAIEVQSYLRTKNTTHPAAYIELFSPEEPLQNSKWSDEECEQLLQCIEYILFSKHKFTFILNSIDSICINKVLESKKGEWEFIYAIIYKGVGHRLGILLLLGAKSDFSLKWKAPISGKMKVMVLDSRTRSFIKWKYLKRFSLSECSALNILERIARNSLWIKMEFLLNDFFIEEMICITGINLIFQAVSLDKLRADFYSVLYEYCLYHGLYVQTINEVLPKKLGRIAPSSKKNYIKSCRKAKFLLLVEMNCRKLFKPKNREKNDDIRFAIGMIIRHKLTNEVGVIIGWDEECNLPKKKNKKNIPNHKYREEEETHYSILLSNDFKCYVAQKNLILIENPVPINVFEIGKYFREFDGVSYIPNQEMCSEYPDDEDFKKMFYLNKQSATY